MINKCVFCGESLNEQGLCPNMTQHFRPMCLNCTYCSLHHSIEDGSDNSCVCLNEDNKTDAIQKIKSSFDGGYEIVGIDLAPLPLKEPTRKCKRYKLHSNAIVWTIENSIKQ